MTSNACRPGDIFHCYDDTPRGRHPVLVVSRRELNQGENVVTVLFTTQKVERRKGLPNCVHFPKGSQAGLIEECVLQTEAIAVTPIIRLTGPLGRVEGAKFDEVIGAIGDMLGAHCFRDS